ncbi:MAG: hypothetical protein ACRCWM_05535 [Sarcina sp.]
MGFLDEILRALEKGLEKDASGEKEEITNFEVGKMVALTRTHYTIGMPENSKVDFDKEGKDAIIYNEGCDSHWESEFSTHIKIDRIDGELSIEEFKEWMSKTDFQNEYREINGNLVCIGTDITVDCGLINHIFVYTEPVNSETDIYYLRIIFTEDYLNKIEVRDRILNTFKTIDNKAVDKEKNDREKLLVGQDGKPNAIYLARLLAWNIFFFQPDDIKFDGERYSVVRIGTSNDINDFPELIQYGNQIAYAIVDIVEYIEKDESIRVNINDVTPELRPYLKNKNITAFSFMELFSEGLMEYRHMVFDNVIKVVVDEEIIVGMPNYKEHIKNLVKVLLSYNGIEFKEELLEIEKREPVIEFYEKNEKER